MYSFRVSPSMVPAGGARGRRPSRGPWGLFFKKRKVCQGTSLPPPITRPHTAHEIFERYREKRGARPSDPPDHTGRTGRRD